MSQYHIVIDTNVFFSAIYSRRGAAHKLLRLINSERFDISVSVPLVLEYEDVAKRNLDKLALSIHEIDDIIDFICVVASRQEIFYLWRPFLRDPQDDMVLELAVAAQSNAIVTFNTRDFQGTEVEFGISVITPKEFLQKIGEIK